MEPYSIAGRKVVHRSCGRFEDLDFVEVHGYKVDGQLIGRVVAGTTILESGIGKMGFVINGDELELGPGDESLYVLEDFRGNGVGEELVRCAIEYVLQIVREDGVNLRFAKAMTNKGNTESKNLLEKLGFRVAKEYRKILVYKKRFDFRH